MWVRISLSLIRSVDCLPQQLIEVWAGRTEEVQAFLEKYKYVTQELSAASCLKVQCILFYRKLHSGANSDDNCNNNDNSNNNDNYNDVDIDDDDNKKNNNSSNNNDIDNNNNNNNNNGNDNNNNNKNNSNNDYCRNDKNYKIHNDNYRSD